MISAKSLGAMPQFVLEHVGQRALDLAFERTGLPHRFTEQRDGYITEHMLAEFVEAIERATGEQDIGLLWAPRLTVADYGAWGAYVLSAPDLGKALKRANEVMPFHASADRTDLVIEGGFSSFSYRFALSGHNAYPSIAFSALGAILSIFRHHLGERWKPARVNCDFRRPINADDVEATFGCPVMWQSKRLEIVFPREALMQKKSPQGAKAVTVDDISRERSAGAPTSFQDVVAQTLRLQLEDHTISMERTARSLDIGVRTLQRRLLAENLSFRALTNRVVMGGAIELLKSGDLSVGSIATELGYNSPNNFSRAFKDWFGIPPTEFRMDA